MSKTKRKRIFSVVKTKQNSSVLIELEKWKSITLDQFQITFF